MYTAPAVESAGSDRVAGIPLEVFAACSSSDLLLVLRFFCVINLLAVFHISFVARNLSIYRSAVDSSLLLGFDSGGACIAVTLSSASFS